MALYDRLLGAHPIHASPAEGPGGLTPTSTATSAAGSSSASCCPGSASSVALEVVGGLC